MPKSIAVSLIVALVGTFSFAFARFGSAPPPTEQTYVAVAVAFFNTAAITSLFVILVRAETATPAKFGKVIRDNIATVVVALMINLVTSVIDVFKFFL